MSSAVVADIPVDLLHLCDAKEPLLHQRRHVLPVLGENSCRMKIVVHNYFHAPMHERSCVMK